ncbi:hypothetical protein [Chryseobacterium binzhouense]|uniref:hypothetical protein n=1 Tax=Chryseobacterium binzhouense TaxID=2593646 RepID=UPI00289EB5A8|nr:hypothetical protein [Chryseobacterium binzhouense]
MKDSTIINIGNYAFWVSFVLISFCFLGSFTSEEFLFGILGAILMLFGGFINMMIFFFLLIYGSYHESQFNICYKSAMTILKNILVIIFYGILIKIIEL